MCQGKKELSLRINREKERKMNMYVYGQRSHRACCFIICEKERQKVRLETNRLTNCQLVADVRLSPFVCKFYLLLDCVSCTIKVIMKQALVNVLEISI